MAPATARFRRQHAELGALARALAGRLEPLQPAEALLALAQLAGKLRVHSAMEDDALYPHLLVHEDESVREVASRFALGFGPVYREFLAFRDRWPSVEAVARAPRDFVREARAFLAALGERIARENAELYAMVDRLERSSMSRAARARHRMVR